MAILKFLQVVILFGLLNIAFADNQCEPDEDSPAFIVSEDEQKGTDLESAKTALEEKGDKEGFNNLVKDVALAATLTSKDGTGNLKHEDKETNSGSESLCYSRFYKWWIGGAIQFPGGNICYVLKPWWNRVFTSISYATCRRQKCINMPKCSNSWMSPYKWQCEPTNYKTFYIWLYCPKPFWYIRIPIHRPQCCECKRQKFWITFGDTKQ